MTDFRFANVEQDYFSDSRQSRRGCGTRKDEKTVVESKMISSGTEIKAGIPFYSLGSSTVGINQQVIKRMQILPLSFCVTKDFVIPYRQFIKAVVKLRARNIQD